MTARAPHLHGQGEPHPAARTATATGSNNREHILQHIVAGAVYITLFFNSIWPRTSHFMCVQNFKKALIQFRVIWLQNIILKQKCTLLGDGEMIFQYFDVSPPFFGCRYSPNSQIDLIHPEQHFSGSRECKMFHPILSIAVLPPRCLLLCLPPLIMVVLWRPLS